jgi:DNA repair exonuclease SbcCD ATPase subunit
MVRLRRLVLTNFRSFKGRHVIDFPERGIVIVRGNNHDTRGDSGAGKTNILLAIAYAFGFCPYSQKDLQCWYDDEPMVVEVYMDTDEGEAVLVRGDKLALKVGDEKAVKGSAKAVEARLDQLCGVNAKLREAVTYRDQVNPIRFLDMRDSDLKQFLVQVLRLEGLEREIDVRTKTLTTLKEAVSQAQALAEAARAEVATRSQEVAPHVAEDTTKLEAAMAENRLELEAALEFLDVFKERVRLVENEIATVSNRALLEHKDEIHALQQNLKTIQFTPIVTDEGPLRKIQEQLEQCRRHMGAVAAADAVARASFDRDTEALRARIRHLHNELAKAPSLLDDISRLQGEAEQLKTNICDRCHRVWEDAQRQFDNHVKEIDSKQSLLEQVCTHRPEVERLENEVRARAYAPDPRLDKFKIVERSLESKIAAEAARLRGHEKVQELERQEKVSRAEALLAEAVSNAKADAQARVLQTSEHLAKVKEEVAVMQSHITDLRTRIQGQDKELSLALLRNQQGATRYAEASARVAVAEKKFQELQRRAVDADEMFKRESDYLDMLKGFRNKIFDEVLGEVGDEATDLVGLLPNAAHATVEFQSERTTDAGTTRQEIKPVIYLHGHARPLRSSVSGGQLTSISLAIDLAVGRVISRRLGCNLNWVILDEAFNGHDMVTKTSCLELLRAYAEDRLVIVIDHASEFKELVAQVITVEYKDKLSRVVQS